MSKEEIRQRAAIAVLPECARQIHYAVKNGEPIFEPTPAKQAAMMAVAYADAIAEKLSNLEQNGKECKPANFAKSSKDLQALVDEEIKRRCDAIDATKMSDRYYHTLCEQWFKCDVAHDRELGYMKGVEDTIKKLKTK